MDDLRAAYKALKAQADAAYAAAEPQRKALHKAEELYLSLHDKIDKLIEGVDVETCDGCFEPIFEGDKANIRGDDYTTCESCSPSYRDILDAPHCFYGTSDGDQHMTAEEAKRICDDHVTDGGSLDDKMVRRDGN